MTQNVQPAGSVLTNYGVVVWIVYGVLSGGGHWREKSDKQHVIPCHHALAEKLHAYINADLASGLQRVVAAEF